MSRRGFLSSLALVSAAAAGPVLLGACAAPRPANRAAPGQARPPVALDAQELGPSAVSVQDWDWLDTRRDRAIPVRLYLPQETRATPLLVFSHGLGGSRFGYSNLGRYWASHGLASLHLQHAGSDRALWGSEGLALLSALRSAASTENAIARVLDVRFALDQALSAPSLAGRIDGARVGVAGHSFGANTALLACGARFRQADGKVLSFGDERVRAALLMSVPSLPTDQDAAYSYGVIRVPTMHLTGTQDITPIPGLSTMPAQRREAFDSLSAGPRYLGVFEGGRHSMFNDWARDETSQAIKVAARRVSLAFWREALLGDSGSAAFLRALPRGEPTLGGLLATWEALS